MAEIPCLRILHISDLHFTPSIRREEVWGKQIVPKEMLAEDIVQKFLQDFKRFLEQFSEDLWPKIVIVSGDLVETGGHEPGEFERAKNFLSELAIALKLPDKKRIFVVPGNHDVNWYKGVDLKDRFADYFNAVQEFSSPELTETGLTIYHQDLSNLVHNISLEVTLFISPTYSGVPDPTVEEIQHRVRKLQEGIDEKEILGDFKLLDIAAIGADQRTQIQPPKNGDNPIRIAVLHHHLLPDNQLEVSQFESVVDAGRMLDVLMANNYDLVLTGHKHNRRLVQLRNKERKGAIDVYTAPSLFKDEGRGFTIIDVHGSASSYYATLNYFDLNCHPKLPPQPLGRDSRILPHVSEVCADISPLEQQEILLPVLASVRDYTNIIRETAFESFFRGIWEQVSEDLSNVGHKRLVFRSPRIWEQWKNLVQLAQNRNEEIKLASKNDLDFWLSAKRPLSEAGKYSEALRQFQGNKVRILVLDEVYLTNEEEIVKCIEVVQYMIQQNFQVALVPVKNTTNDVMQDFGLIGDSAVSIFEGREDFTRSLRESFNEDDLKKARRDWQTLWESRAWDSNGTEELKDFFHRYTY